MMFYTSGILNKFPYTMDFESLYHINAPQFSGRLNDEFARLTNKLLELLKKDKRKKLILLTGTIFSPRGAFDEIPGRAFLSEKNALGPSMPDLFVANRFFENLRYD